MKIILGVNDIPYSEPPPRRISSRRGRRPVKVASGTQTTGDVAGWLEGKYKVMETFVALHEGDITAAIEESLGGALETMLMGGPAGDLMGAAMSQIESDFRGFLDRDEMAGAGVAGVPTAAAQRGVSHRRARPNARGNPPRPSFIDTGTYQANFRAWTEE